MQRFFFHFVSPDETLRDERGVVLSGLAAAHAHAMKLVRELVPVLPEADRRRWRIEIADNWRRHRVSVLFPVSALLLRPAAPAGEAAFAAPPHPLRASAAKGGEAAQVGRVPLRSRTSPAR